MIIARKNIALFGYILIAVLVWPLRPNIDSSIDRVDITLYLILALALISMHLISVRERNKFRIDLVFLLGFYIVHFQWPVLLMLVDYEPLLFAKAYSNAAYISYGTWLSVFGIAAWLIGNASVSVPIRPKLSIAAVSYEKLLVLAVVLFGAFVISAGEYFLSGEVYKQGGTDKAISGVAGYFFTLLNIVMVMLISTVTFNSGIKSKQSLRKMIAHLDIRVVLIISLYCGVFLYVGDRGSVIQIVIAFLLVYSTLVKPISAVQFSIITLGGGLFLTFVGIYRTGESVNIFGAEIQSVYDVTMTLANSARTLYSGLEYIDQTGEYFFGKLWIGNLLGIIPFFQRMYLELSGDEAYLINSASFITYLRYGEDPPSGEGTSLIIDIFLNFGVIGVFGMMFLLGILTKILQTKLNQCRSYTWILVASLFGSLALYISRATYFTPLQLILWALIIRFLLIRKRPQP